MRFRAIVSSSLLMLSTVLGSTFTTGSKEDLPVIDLGYELHQSLSYNKSSEVYLFQNIRYAQPPTGERRFRAPAAPKIDRTAVRNGSELRNCPQGMPVWQAKAYGPIRKFSDPRNSFNLTAWEEAIATARIPELELNAETTEDCLFLDVHVQKGIFDRAQQDLQSSQSSDGAPVLVWIHGGGYTLGSKTGAPTPVFFPDGLLAQADSSDEGMVFVALNYRLGALGFLAGPEVAADGDLNAGLLDQRLALEWVQKHIHLFGGSAKRVTVMGESAGGGSAILQTAAFGGKKGPAPFAQIIAQSPAAMPNAQPVPNAFSDFLAALNVSTLDEARRAASSDVIRANEVQIDAAPAVNYNFGPVLDGTFMPNTIGKALSSGAYDKSVQVLSSHNLFEGGFFYDPTVRTEDEFRAWLDRSIIGLDQAQTDYLSATLYPPNFDGSLGYVDQATRQMALWEEAVILCHFQSLNQAVGGNSYAYEFGIPPGFHTQDLKYTFNDPTSPVPFPQAQDLIQRSIATFVKIGIPVLDSKEQTYPVWGSNHSTLKVAEIGAQVGRSGINETRCTWWRDV
ncbi:hypothetical protein PFICI_06522 [Pestalotiopsis fici W106-1]|uniref:Carboxylic ester hydrolase n=1 Tax=Pestalotiopsis fici (strain W106-1 / CGMCC3.15140) TaxID=1229662 RepID=W3X643_PESFW|nr:uncharacterized protein PFICI_06522 [Pestalotiopsis fici W106-1]ETS81520.1 hypothetical protein PFICI_06522 [Pestalotiopsis fici W106-1]